MPDDTDEPRRQRPEPPQRAPGPAFLEEAARFYSQWQFERGADGQAMFEDFKGVDENTRQFMQMHLMTLQVRGLGAVTKRLALIQNGLAVIAEHIVERGKQGNTQIEALEEMVILLRELAPEAAPEPPPPPPTAAARAPAAAPGASADPGLSFLDRVKRAPTTPGTPVVPEEAALPDDQSRPPIRENDRVARGRGSRARKAPINGEGAPPNGAG